MTEQPQNLRKVKTEHLSPSTPEKSSNNIKERLNMHVKRRLQLPVELVVTSEINAITADPSKHAELKIKHLQPHPLKTRKYQKRNEKFKAIGLPDMCGDMLKYNSRQQRRKKIKPIESSAAASVADLAVGDGNEDSGAVASVSFASASSYGGDDDGSQDGRGGGGDCNEVEAKSGRDKEKCPDILSLVLSVKKRMLMQHPEVVEFLKRIRTEMKN